MSRLIAVAMTCWVVLTAPAVPKLEAWFHMDKDNYMVGEPIYLTFKMTNTTDYPVEVEYSCLVYRIEVWRGMTPPTHPSCITAAGAGCSMAMIPLRPGASHTDRILLNQQHDFSKPGTYCVTATRYLNHSMKVSDQFELVIEPSEEDRLKLILQPYVADLESTRPDHRDEDIRVITSVAPPFLEKTIVGMLDSNYWNSAMAGLRRLNTERARSIIAGVATQQYGYRSVNKRDDPDGVDDARNLAIGYLGEMGDRCYLSLILDRASSAKPNSKTRRAATYAAATLGGADSLPFLLKLLQGQNRDDQILAARALPATASRAAVAVLIDLLRERDELLSGAALAGLISLTHRSPARDLNHKYLEAPAAQYPAWLRWWTRHAESAPIYSPKECGEVEPLE